MAVFFSWLCRQSAQTGLTALLSSNHGSGDVATEVVQVMAGTPFYAKDQYHLCIQGRNFGTRTLTLADAAQHLHLQLIADAVRRCKCKLPTRSLDCLLGLRFPDIVPSSMAGDRW